MPEEQQSQEGKQPAEPAQTPQVSAAHVPKARPTFEARHERAGRIVAARSAERSGATELDTSSQSDGDDGAAAAATGEPKPDAAAQPADKRVAAALAAFDKGDMKALAKALGKDAKAADAHDIKFAAIKRRSERVARREQAADAREAKLDARDIEARNRYGDPSAAVKSYEAGDYHAAATYMQNVFGDDFATITKKMARAISDMPPERLAELKRTEATERENKRLKKEAEDRKHNEKKTAGRSKALETVSTKCKGHEALLLADGADLILRELETSFDGTIDLKKAADAVLDRELKRLEALAPVLEKRRGKGKGKSAAAATEETAAEKPATGRKPRAEQQPEASAAGGSRKLFNGKVALSFEQRQAMAERRTARQRGLS